MAIILLLICYYFVIIMVINVVNETNELISSSNQICSYSLYTNKNVGQTGLFHPGMATSRGEKN